MKIMVLHMGRSGGHGVIKWVIDALPGVVVFGNNCILGWEDKKHIPKKVIVYGDSDKFIDTVKSIEDIYLPVFFEKDMRHWDKYEKIITIVRSPKNWLASSIAAGGFANEYLDKPSNEIELPVSRIEAYFSYFDYAHHWRVFYDRWMKDDKYKESLSRVLGIVNTNRPGHCKFSSFGKNHDYMGNRYKLLNKYQKRRFAGLWEKYPRLGKIQEEF